MKKISLLCITLLAVASGFAQADSTLKEYTGRYVFPDGNVVPDVSVRVDGDNLVMSSSAGESALTRLGIDSFSVVEFSGTAVFKRNASNKVIGVHIEAAGYVMDGVKEEGNGIAFYNQDNKIQFPLNRSEGNINLACNFKQYTLGLGRLAFFLFS